MALEIEKKYLVDELPRDLDSFPNKKIVQGYVAIEPEGNELRVRQMDQHFFLTVKDSGNQLRSEFEFEISEERFRELLIFCGTRVIEKTRFFIPHGEYTIELDVFEGRLSGLKTAEVEFSSEDQAEVFQPPAWFGNDVTNEKKYKNRVLACRE